MPAFKLPRTQKVYEELCAKYPDASSVFEYFLRLTEVPRPSHHTAEVSKWAVAMGHELGAASVKSDSFGNVCILMPASAGKEDLPGLVVQAHLDMVGTKTAASTHDFLKDPIEPIIDGDKLRANGTTLGGDDGSGVAVALALAANKNIPHPQIEVLFTVDEEVGCLGAVGMKDGELLSSKAKYLVNVDSEDWGEITLSCAGGVNRIISVPVERAAQSQGWSHFNIVLKDFRGGHSGVEIQAGRANATKWLTQMLLENSEAIKGAEYRLTTMHGGNAHNAIPSFVEAEFSVPEAEADKFVPAMSNVFHRLVNQYSFVEKTAIKEPKMVITKLAKPSIEQALTFSSTRTVLEAITGVHHGVFKWSEAVPTLVETSESESVTDVKADGPALIEIYARSSINESLDNLIKYLDAYAALYGGKTTTKIPDMPGWPAEPDSVLCKKSLEVFKQCFGYDAKLVPIHAGLECGIIINKFPANKMQAISIGPDVKNPHTVDEFLGLPSCVHMYTFIVKLCEALAQ